MPHSPVPSPSPSVGAGCTPPLQPGQAQGQGQGQGQVLSLLERLGAGEVPARLALVNIAPAPRPMLGLAAAIRQRQQQLLQQQQRERQQQLLRQQMQQGEASLGPGGAAIGPLQQLGEVDGQELAMAMAGQWGGMSMGVPGMGTQAWERQQQQQGEGVGQGGPAVLSPAGAEPGGEEGEEAGPWGKRQRT